ncbi:hypothetical protein FACS189451_01510 [Bacteroidia bacterium]|nr:hypothetical protein FACS189451_01510 [Bacteroidia bacterium]
MRKVSTKNGSNTSVKVHAIVSNGITVEVLGNTYFLPYNSNPWFENAKVSEVFDVEMLGNEGIRWEALDVDLAIDSFIHPERYPLIAKHV